MIDPGIFVAYMAHLYIYIVCTPDFLGWGVDSLVYKLSSSLKRYLICLNFVQSIEIARVYCLNIVQSK